MLAQLLARCLAHSEAPSTRWLCVCMLAGNETSRFQSGQFPSFSRVLFKMLNHLTSSLCENPQLAICHWLLHPRSTLSCLPSQVFCSQHFSDDCFPNLPLYAAGFLPRLLLKVGVVTMGHGSSHRRLPKAGQIRTDHMLHGRGGYLVSRPEELLHKGKTYNIYLDFFLLKKQWMCVNGYNKIKYQF